jgi:thioesterase domain-containing protein
MADPREEVEAVARAAGKLLEKWDEFDGPPLTVEETHEAVSEGFEYLRAALDAARSTQPESCAEAED